jgi:hypothetical protein
MGSEMFLRVSMDVDGLSAVVKANHKHPFFWFIEAKHLLKRWRWLSVIGFTTSYWLIS